MLASFISLSITLLMFCILNFNVSKVNFEIEPSLYSKSIKKNLDSDNNLNNEFISQNENPIIQENSNEEWSIQIERIGLKAEIKEGISQEIIENNVGHFTETETLDGNVGLAAHNRGYSNNYFEKIKELETGDEIIYTYKGIIRKYKVKYRNIIKETDWSFLDKTDDNRLTLITCVEDEPEYRRCIQAIEIKEE